MNVPVTRTKYSVKILFSLLFLVVIIISVLLSQTAWDMHQLVRQRTSRYLLDVNAQIVDKVNGRIENSVQMLRMVRDSALALPEEQVQPFLDHKSSFCEYDSLYLFADVEEAGRWLEKQYSEVPLDPELSAEGEIQLLAVPSQDTLIYCVPDHTDDDPSVIVGIKTKQNLKELMNSDSFNGDGTSFAITQDGIVIMAPSKLDLFVELGQVSNAAGDQAVEQTLKRMEEDVFANKSGIAVLPGSSGKDMMLCYDPLDYAGWYIITIIPADIISFGIDRLSNRDLFLTVLVIVLLMASMLGLRMTYRSSHKKLERLAYCDEVTGGMSGNLFRIMARKTLQGHVQQYALISMDLQDFKLINKMFGTAEGNRTLKYLHQMLQNNLSGDEPMARDSGDVFYFLMKTREEDAICARLKNIYDNVNAFNQTRRDPFYLELCFGIYLPETNEEFVDMQEKANLARKYKKGDFRYRYNFYNEENQSKTFREKELAAMVDHSLRDGDFIVYLQPKVGLKNKRVEGAEALIRWKHPEKGMLSPGMFIPLAEKYRLISRLDLFVFEQVCQILARWKQEDKDLMTISVNLSRQNLDNPTFLKDYQAICARYDVAPSLIEFELTETIMFENPQGIKSIIDDIHAYGFRCSLDDFGTGFSALGLLNDLDVDVIKLDRSFFIGKNNSRRGRYVVESILKLAAQLHIHTVAEGIDNLEQVQYLREAACDMVQGFYFYKPMPVEEFERQVFEQNHLRYVEIGEDSPRKELAQDESLYSVDEKAAPNSNIVMFSLFTKEDEVVFSTPFSPVLENKYTFSNAKALFRCSDLIHENDREDFFRMLERCQRENIWVENALRFCMAEGRYEWLEVHLHKDSRPVESGRVITGILVNMSGWKNELSRWKEKANRDALTGLYNREFFEHYVEMQLQDRMVDSAAIIFIDIDDFKKANDTMGHTFGDEILCHVAKRILGVFRRTDIAARFGGDEFVVFLSSVSREILINRLEHLQKIFEHPYRSGTLQYKISGSIGAAMYPENGNDYATLLDHADSALYEAKNLGKDRYVLYEPYMLHSSRGGESGEPEQQG